MNSLLLISDEFSNIQDINEFRSAFSEVKKIQWDSQKGTIDESMDDFIKEIFSEKEFDIVYLPAVFGHVYTDFLGIRLLYHIRFTQSIGNNRYIPLVIYTSDSFYDIAMNTELYSIILTPEIYLKYIDDNLLDILYKESFGTLNEHQLKKYVAQKIHLQIPSSYYDNHSIANEWGAYQLDNVAQTEALDIEHNPKFKHIYFKWLQSYYMHFIRNEEINNAESHYKHAPKLEGPKFKGKIDLNNL